MITTLSVDKTDLERFIKARLGHQATIGKELSNAEFFNALLDAWEKYHIEVKP